MNSPSESITQVIIVGLLAGLLLATFAWRSRRMVARVILGVFAAGFLVPSAILFIGRNPWLIDARHRTFQLFYWNIRMDMSRQEVIAEMQNWYPPDQPRMAPTIKEDSADKLEFEMNPESNTQKDHEGIVIRMQEGHVIGKSYEPD